MQAQTTFATITGAVTDSSGAAVPNVTVIVKNLATGVEARTVSNEVGNYTVAQLREGTYSVSAQASGFKEFIATDVILVPRDIRRIDITLEVGSIETKVEVSAGSALIETETARISDTRTAEVLKSLPLNTRTIWASLALSPNVLQAAGSSTVRFAGSQRNQSNWAIDGITSADGVDNTQIGQLQGFLEHIQDMKIDMANNTAEFGAIGQVTMTTKAGTNAFHGSVIEYYSSPWFRARNPFSNYRPTDVSHWPGVTAGGPVYLPKVYDGRNKTFFFFSYETARGSLGSRDFYAGVPIPAWRNGDFSSLLPDTVIYDPTTKQPFQGNKIPAGRINPVSRKIQDRFYPLPNTGDPNVFDFGNFQHSDKEVYYPTVYWVTRGDHHFSERDWIYGRYSHGLDTWDPWDGDLPTLGIAYWRRFNDGAVVSYTHMFRPTLVNEFRWGFAFNNIPTYGGINGLDLVRDLGLTGLAPNLPDLRGMFNVLWSGVGLTDLTSWFTHSDPGYRNHLEQFQDHVSWFRNRHNLKLGFELTRVEWDDYSASPDLFGTVTFSNRFTSGGLEDQGHPYADFLLGIPTTAARAFPPVRVDRNRWQYDFFVADDFKVSPRLTLNLGLRYELHLPWRENQNLVSMFDIGSGKIVVPDSSLPKVSPLFPKDYVGIVGARAAGFPERTLTRSDRNNIAPRIGIAYRPWGTRTVFRTGYGIYYNVSPRYLNMGALPFVLDEPEYTNPEDIPDVIFPRVFPSTGVSGPSTVGIPAAVNPNIRMPYSMQYNLTIEHERWNTGFRLSYIGTNSRKGDWRYNYNSPVPDARPFIEKPRPFPQYPSIFYLTNGAGHQYNALTATAERQMSRGLYFQSSWTWARDIYDLSSGQSPENPFDRRRERGVAQEIPTHRFTTNALYQVPFGKGKRWLSGASRLLDLAVGGWELSAVYTAQTGQFLTAMWSGSDPTGTAYTESSTPAFVTIRPDQLRDPNLLSSQRSLRRWFDPSAFAPPRLGQFGSAAKGVIKGPGVNVWHLGVFKRIRVNEKVNVRMELTATNAFNHPNWSNPRTNISQAGSVGVISGVGGVNGASTGDQPGVRSGRAGIRVEW